MRLICQFITNCICLLGEHMHSVSFNLFCKGRQYVLTEGKKKSLGLSVNNHLIIKCDRSILDLQNWAVY